MNSEAAKLLIVDGHAYAYRAFYAIRHLRSPIGEPTNALYGFIKMLGKIRSRIQPTHLAVVWDGGMAAERTSSLPEYKANRPAMPVDLERQMAPLIEFLAASQIPSLLREGVEADDWIATLARQASAAGAQVVIASSDKDFMQLVSPRIGLLNPNDKIERIWTDAHVFQKTGVRPEQIVDWLSLIGDSVDNIPGVSGIGPKRASALLSQFGSVSALLEQIERVEPQRLRDEISAASMLLRRNQELIRLNNRLNWEFRLDDYASKPGHRDRLAALYSSAGFKGLLGELEREALGAMLNMEAPN